MEKVGVKKKVVMKSAPLATKKVIPKTNQTEKILVENFVALQKVIVDLAEKLTNLSTQTSKLLGLFETSAKTLAEKGFEDNKGIVQKLDALLDQNKILAKGISLLHEAEEEVKEDIAQTPMPPQQKPAQQLNMPPQQRPPAQSPKPLMPPQQRPPMPPQPPQQPGQQQKKAPINMQEYQKSISAP